MHIINIISHEDIIFYITFCNWWSDLQTVETCT